MLKRANQLTLFFTFHYVSIKTPKLLGLNGPMFTLHSTMSLLKQELCMRDTGLDMLYIPLCLY